jgi:phosphoenolpyruvate---glycerone phosphotransferase subunit DhaL
MELTSKDYVEYLKLILMRYEGCGEYITSLDAATGDGDHWVNINSGFLKLVEISNELESIPITDMMKKIGMTLMSSVGGSSGVLYGSAYISAAKATKDVDTITLPILLNIFKAMLEAIMKRGDVQPGQKTMIDAIHPAVEALKKGIENDYEEIIILENMKKAAIEGAEATRDMVAIRGRACYQANKGVGHLDPGAVTMSYQIETLINFILSKNKCI